MISLRSDGFPHLLEQVARKAREAPDSRQALRIALTLDDRVPEHIGRSALSAPDRVLLDALCVPGAPLAPPAGPGLLVIDPTGRTRLLDAGTDNPGDSHAIGSLPVRERSPEAAERARRERAAERTRYTELRQWLSDQPRAAVLEGLGHIGHVLLHMAPVVLYAGESHFSNFGRSGNLPGRSMTPDDPGNLLLRLAGIPTGQWSPEEGAFVALALVVLRSGTQSRLEEFNGTQLAPAPVEQFMNDRITGYGGRVPDVAHLPVGPRLDALARQCAELRRDHVRNGSVFYRLIHGTNLNKQEHLLRPAVTYADVPAALREFLAGACGIPPRTATTEETAPLLDRLAPHLHRSTPPAGFSSAYEALLTGFMTTLADATASDVAMGRGPRSTAALRPDSAGAHDPLLLRTGDFFCCVAPGAAFGRLFGEDRAALVRTLSAYSARMRFNTWHYLPHTLGISDRVPGRDDWFFAPTMPDLTHWSDQHHTGHVTFGVRFAIRVPLGIDHAGRHLPGLYDLRLMRARGDRYTPRDLRAAVAAGRVLAALHQAMSRHGATVRDFGNDWFRAFYG